MSVEFQNASGHVLDARSLIDQGYSRCVRWRAAAAAGHNHMQHFSCRFKRQCFDIAQSRQFAVSSRADVNVTDHVDTTTESPDQIQTIKPTKKRKRRHSHLNQGEIDSQVYHDTIRVVILEGTKSLVNGAKSHGYLDGVTAATEDPLPHQDCNLAALCDMAKELPLLDSGDQDGHLVQSIGTAEDGCAANLDLFSRITENPSDWAVEVTLMGEKYIIPPQTTFLLSDFSAMQPLVHYGRRFDLIVMDPPWENKSAKRSGRYRFLPSSKLRFLPIPLLASPGCLVVTWVTNRPSHLRYVREELYPHWGVEVLAEWFWVKVTWSGEFVFPLDSPHKKPYELLLLGRYRKAATNPDSSSMKSEVPVEDQRVIVSVPSALHSHKPSLSEVLRPYVGAEAQCLELFARSLQPGWTSWGNEVIKFQHISYFTVTPMADNVATAHTEERKKIKSTDMSLMKDTPPTTYMPVKSSDTGPIDSEPLNSTDRATEMPANATINVSTEIRVNSSLVSSVTSPPPPPVR